MAGVPVVAAMTAAGVLPTMVVVIVALVATEAGDGISDKKIKESPLLSWRAECNTKGEVVPSAQASANLGAANSE